MVSDFEKNWKERRDSVRDVLTQEIQGRITGMTGLIAETADFPAPVGANCEILSRSGSRIPAEVIGFRDEISLIMPMGEMTGISCGDYVRCVSGRTMVPVGPQLLGRVIDGQGRPIDGKGALLCPVQRPVESECPQPLQRRRITTALGTGVRAIDGMTTCGRGQRMGIFSGPGVGKSVLMGMIARYTAADVTVIALVGERGREVRDFIEKDLGPEGLKRSVVVVSTSDEAAPLRVRAGFTATTVAEYFRDQGKDVLLLMDSVTRIAMAQRQIGLSRNEPPATKGYTPSVFALLPRLLERCGTSSVGSITGFFTVLVESDDMTEPISDAMRSILDGHLWLSRDLANRGHYPAIDILGSISRVMTDITDKEHQQAARKIIRNMAVYRDIEDLVNIGAYATGSNSEFDLAIRAREPIQQYLAQAIDDRGSLNDTISRLKNLAAQIDSSIMTNRSPMQNAAPTIDRKPVQPTRTNIPGPRAQAGRVSARNK